MKRNRSLENRVLNTSDSNHKVVEKKRGKKENKKSNDIKKKKRNNLLSTSREKILIRIEKDSNIINKFQRIFGIQYLKEEEFKNKNGFRKIISLIFFVLFKFGSALGNEMFYITFLPFIKFFVNEMIGRRLVICWGFLYYIGQLLKDMLKLPRPSKERVNYILESHYETEYGMPSTHSMSATTLPIYLSYLMTIYRSDENAIPILFFDTSFFRNQFIENLFFFNNNYYNLNHIFTVPLLFGILIWITAFMWFMLTTSSRLYQGVHSLVDIYSGVLLGTLILALFITQDIVLDRYLIYSESPFTEIVIIILIISLVILYGFLINVKIWTSCYGDTTLILGVVLGQLLGTRYHVKVLRIDPLIIFDGTIPNILCSQIKEKYDFIPDYYFYFISSCFIIIFLRWLIGSLILIIIRAIVKPLCINIMLKLLPASDTHYKQRYTVEIPTKLVTYFSLTFSVFVIFPIMFDFLDLKDVY
eukprot:TRINITY_DN4579_c3_g1_i1.p1 TRINITY_DN4579_c3_g1~~TRINITY_DN4579_c3_g1_i1.p1  ORF type:complete len:473 (-),score=65.74 TRINITY_DN4579_c3_g1_i1:117-1535(-)